MLYLMLMTLFPSAMLALLGIVVLVPDLFHTRVWLSGMTSLIRRRQFLAIPLYLALSTMPLVNRFLMAIEDVIFSSGLRQVVTST